ncbi:hypothetical protein RLPCCGM1_p0746 [Rhizobium leguminosarum bv. phaseoli CCGM1]|uniref:hypothetical protein n=1 Tax=Rhizobium phaseoli TaxID=396 RepID=UPI00028360E6|nr:hypothetical protein [Rhizobium phaseoli]EJZ16920.1 hypothetical protein RCCGEPOP_33508 [Rhizobium sp. Pop5]KEC70631.1 hypothetical protein RLPCCGM1_p0746 [Rhizobium leguminosarum bv. phaseoli CCGM1]PWI50608.1 hypothetical protein B5K03_30025 [Rhizobium phaseoli]RUM11741.1 hypothetical protein EFD56_31100 [Rhizobium phaseoli]
MKGSYWAPSVNGNGTARSTRIIGIASSHFGDSDGTRTFARHSFVGALADALPDARAFVGLGRQIAIKLMFVLYAVVGVAGAVLYSRIPTRLANRATTEAAAALGP